MYHLAMKEGFEKKVHKLKQHDAHVFEMLSKKIDEVLIDPYRFKPLRKPLQNKRRVHVAGCFVLVYEIKEAERLVTLFDFDHHDNVYQHVG